MIVNVWRNKSFIIINVLNLFFIIIEKSTEGSAARKTLIGWEDPCRWIAELIMRKEKLKLHETAKWDFWALPCPEGMALCLSQGWPVTFQCVLSLFTGLDPASCPQWICFMDAVELCVNVQRCALVPQDCPGRQLSRQAPPRVFLWQEQCSSSPDSSSAGVVLQDETSWPCSGKEGEGQHTRRRQPEEEKRGPKWRNSSSHLCLGL